ncbi:hypothetical protein KP509_33G040000 [Ceratopteris richardii]|uniref:FAD-binding FR-type domain-containing protein n=1 Tax=Ceratopteris richardii TaxID=49495 RepID=A0A8T2QPA0_CERRI|nr:hypothetical protein KP509_33G040000 [Ceratopteris richardii]
MAVSTRGEKEVEVTSSQNRWIAATLKAVAEMLIAAACLMWVLYWFFSPEPNTDDDHLSNNTKSRFFRTDGREGYSLIYQTLPWVVVAALSFLVIGIRSVLRKEETKTVSKGNATFKISRLCTYPLWARSPFGVLTASDFLIVIAFLFVTFYHFGRKTHLSFKEIDAGKAMHHHGPVISKQWQKVQSASYYFGTISIIPFSLLWIPVSRGSPLLRLIGLPFEHAVRYHIWLAVFMMVFVSLHSIGYIVLYMNTDQTSRITSWETINEKCSVVAGLVAWIAGLVVSLTSLPFFRRRWYEFFFAVHHLYVVYALFWLYHAVWNYHFFVIPILLFFVDRCLRFLQSRTLVDVVSATVLESNAIELRLARNSNDGMMRHALSTWCIQLPSISRIQWHFFSSSSTNHKDEKEVIIIIKPLGSWTRRLHKVLADNDNNHSSSKCPFSFKARVEGAYNDESDFYLRYDSLILVAGGIGITPFLAILKDILYRYARTLNKKLDLPTSVELYYCVRTPEELSVLKELDILNILPSFKEHGLNIKIYSYVTSGQRDNYQAFPYLQNNLGTNKGIDFAEYGGFDKLPTLSYTSPSLTNERCIVNGISPISNVGETCWVASITIFSMVGYFVLSGLANLYIVEDYTKNFPNYNRAHVVVACLVLGILGFGGILAGIWYIILKRKSEDHISTILPFNTKSASTSPQAQYAPSVNLSTTPETIESGESHFLWEGDLHIGGRPDWKDVFSHIKQRYRGMVVGVLVSGSESMQEDVAVQCGKHSSFLFQKGDEDIILEYHSVSFDL